MTMQRFWLFAALCIAPVVASAQSHLARTNPPGPYPVGLRVVEQYDLSRGYRGVTDPDSGEPTTGERARPIQTLVWYPAAGGGGRAMTAGDYLALGATGERFPATPAERQRLEARYVGGRVGTLTPERITVALLYIDAPPRQLEDLPADMNQDRSFLNKMKYADLYRVTLAPYVHANFATFGQRFLGDGDYGDYDARELSVANDWLETWVRRFLDASLKGDATGRAFLGMSPAEIGAPAHLFTIYRTKAQPLPPTRTSFAAELATKGFDNALDVYQATQKRDPAFALSDGDLNSWGYKLLRAGDLRRAIAIMRLNTQVHPESANAFDSLGETYAANGDKALAIQAYRKSLALDPGNRNAAEQIARLGG
jgi:hypothetical protein